MKKAYKLLIVLAIAALGFSNVYAYTSYLTSFTTKYPSTVSSQLNGCVLCHIDPAGGGTRNPFGTDFASASIGNHTFNAALEARDSDGDGFTNIQEIKALTLPGDATSHPAMTMACTSYTYTLGACQPNGAAAVVSYVGMPAGCSGGATPATTQPCTYVPPTCTSFTYSAWGACQADGTQTRTVTASSPSGCTGGTPVTSQSCTYVPPTTACTSYTYTVGACQPNGTAPVTSSVGIPAGCSGGVTPATTQPCTYVPSTCTSFTYSAWGACQSNGTQTRTVTASSPSGCTGGTPVTSQSCTYTPPVTGSGMPMPTSQEVFPYDPVAAPVPSSDPGQAMPMGLGAVATGGSSLTLRITASFQSPVNIYVTMYTPSTSGFTPYNVKMLGSGGNFGSVTMSGGAMQMKKWKTGVTGVDQTVINNVPLSQLKAGLYYVVMTVTPTAGNRNYYQWVTYFNVPRGESGDD